MIKPLKNKIAVKLEGTDAGRLSEYKSKGGIVLSAPEMSSGNNSFEGLKDRWAIVIAVGKDVNIVAENDRVLVEAGKWTSAMKIDGDYVWITEDKFVSLIDENFLKTNERANIEIM